MSKIRDVLNKKGSEVWSVNQGATVYDALKLMAKKNVGGLPVVDGDRLVGIFTERDYARKVILKDRSSKATRVEELMTEEVYTLTPDGTIDECMALMNDAHCRHVPVLEGETLVGLVSIGDIVNAKIRQQNIQIRSLEQYIRSS